MADHFECYSVGLCHASVCTNMDPAAAAARLNEEHPTGIASSWSLSKEPTFKCGTSNGCPCAAEHAPGARHYLFSC